MFKYEIVCIIHPDLDETMVKENVERISTWITNAGGTISKVDFLGKKELAYPIRKKLEGQYVLFETNMQPSFCADLERDLGILEPVMRFLIVKK